MLTFAEGIVVGAPASSGVTIDLGPLLIALVAPLILAALIGVAAAVRTKLGSRRKATVALRPSHVPVADASSLIA